MERNAMAVMGDARTLEREKIATRLEAKKQALAKRRAEESTTQSGEAKDWTQVYASLANYVDEEDIAEDEKKLKAASKDRRAVAGCDADHSDERQLFEMPLADLLTKCEEFKIHGNAYFREGVYMRAAERYRKALVYLEYAFPRTDEDEKATDTMRIACLVNSALCMLRLRDYGEAIQNCYEVLTID